MLDRITEQPFCQTRVIGSGDYQQKLKYEAQKKIIKTFEGWILIKHT